MDTEKCVIMNPNNVLFSVNKYLIILGAETTLSGTEDTVNPVLILGIGIE